MGSVIFSEGVEEQLVQAGLVVEDRTLEPAFPRVKIRLSEAQSLFVELIKEEGVLFPQLLVDLEDGTAESGSLDLAHVHRLREKYGG